MANIEEILQLCRLCLQKENVKTAIFEDEDDVKEILLKITSCLPVKVTKDDKLPKKICDHCTGKLESFYDFWKTSAESEKQLFKWLNHIGVSAEKSSSQVTGIKASESLVLKQEIPDPSESKSEEDNSSDAVNDSEYLPPHSEKKRDTLQASNSESNEPPVKRARRSVTLKKPVQMSESDDEFDEGADPKVEDDSENSEDADDPDFADESRNDDDHANIDDQPGPSGVGKSTEEQSIMCSKEMSKSATQGRSRTTHKEFACPVCNKRFPFKYSLQIHEARHLNQFKAKCEECNTGFFTKHEYEKHYRRRHKGIEYKCFHCGKTFLDEDYFKYIHIPTHGKSYVGKIYTCNFCSKEYQSKSGLAGHKRSHHQNLQYICYICGKSVTSIVSLREHIMIHRGEKPFVCETCGKCFNKKRLLKIHIRIHTKDKPYNCEVCKKAFSQKSSLTIHQRYHTGERPYPCVLCSKSFITKSLLKLHHQAHDLVLSAERKCDSAEKCDYSVLLVTSKK